MTRPSQETGPERTSAPRFPFVSEFRSNLRLRFAAWTSALFFLAIVTYGTMVFVTMDIFLHASVRDSLRSEAELVIANLNIDSGVMELPESLGETSGDEGRAPAFTIRLADPKGVSLLESGTFLASLPSVAKPPERALFQTAEPDLAVYTTAVRDNGINLAILQVAQPTEGLEKTLRQLFLIVACSLIVFLPASAAGGYFLAVRLLKPIDTMTRTARLFSAEDLSARIGLPPTDDEIGRLAATFDEMLERVERSFMSYRQFTADASHELRTPVSVMRAILSVTSRRARSVEEYQTALRDLDKAADRLERLVSDLLFLSRLDMADPPPRHEIDVGSLLSGLTESLRPLAEGKRLGLACEIHDDLPILGDEDAILHAFINVVDNAIKYTDRGSVTVRAIREGDDALVLVRDTGVGIEGSDLPNVFDRFFRGEKSRTVPGSGLGLAIAKAIIEGHRGRISVKSEPGKGTEMAIRLPLDQRASGTK